ncbi:MAG: methyltransferase domain-containing protein [Pseudomonadota bacterium]
MTDAIKTMGLYPRADRILADLAHLGFGPDAPLTVDVLSQFDQLHYHGTAAIDAAIDALGIGPGDRVLEVGAGWGGCARYLAQKSGAQVTAVELQGDYNSIGADLTARAGLGDQVTHVEGDFLTVPLPVGGFDHAVSWLALFHIPDRAAYLGRIAGALRPGGGFFAEDLFHRTAPPPNEMASFQAHLFPKSVVGWEDYGDGLDAAGFGGVALQDMSDDWAAFTATRLAAFRENRTAYAAVHGDDGYERIHTFYDQMAGYLARGIVGGVKAQAHRS